MPVIGESLILASTQPNFTRDKVKSILDLKNVKLKQYDVGHIVYCSEDGRHYIFEGDKIEFDEVYGYFRVLCESIEDEEIDGLLNSLDITPVYPIEPSEPENPEPEIPEDGDENNEPKE